MLATVVSFISNLILQVSADSLAVGKGSVRESIDSLTLLIVFVSVFGIIVIIRMIIRQKKRRGKS